MQFSHFILAVMVILLTTCNDFAAAVKCGVKPDNLRTVQSVPIVNLAAVPKTHATSTQEERAGTNVGASARTIGGAAVPINGPMEDAGDKMVTVTTYNDNGFFQRVGKWWRRTFGQEDKQLRQ